MKTGIFASEMKQTSSPSGVAEEIWVTSPDFWQLASHMGGDFFWVDLEQHVVTRNMKTLYTGVVFHCWVALSFAGIQNW